MTNLFILNDNIRCTLNGMKYSFLESLYNYKAMDVRVLPKYTLLVAQSEPAVFQNAKTGISMEVYPTEIQ